MKSKIASGVWLVFFGIIALLHNFNIIDFNFWAILTYWPLLIISIGLNLIFQNRENGSKILLAANILLCLFLTYQGLTSKERLFDWRFQNTAMNKEQLAHTSSDVKVDYKSVDRAELEFNLGAAKVNIGELATPYMLTAKGTNAHAGIKVESSYRDDKAIIELNTYSRDTISNKSGNIDVSLHPEPNWDLTFNMGAASFTADLTAHKIHNLEVNAGAADLRLKLGLPTIDKTHVEINAAASSTTIQIPRDAACQVETSILFSSKKLKEFIKKDNVYQTENFDQASKKYYIKINGAANSLNINRY